MASTENGGGPPALKLDALIQSLPACKRCRECRRGCDTLLPSCKQCNKAGAECMFFDHGRNELLPRSYIAELVDRVRRLSPQQTPSSDSPSQELMLAPSKSESVASDPRPHYEHHFAFAGDTYRYLGSDSCLLKSPRLQPRTVVSETKAFDDDDDDVQLSWKSSRSQSKENELLGVYLEVIQPVYPVLDLSERYVSKPLPSDLSATELFSQNMIYSIGCYIMPNSGHKKGGAEHVWNPNGRLSFHQANSLKYRTLATDYFAKAMEYLEAATVDLTVATLRAVLLLAIHSSFDPKSGNMGQQIALATRLAFDLEAKAQLQELPVDEVAMLWKMHMTIFSLENQLASTLDRPALFPEPSTELSFDKNNPAVYTCSLFRLQNRYRKADHATKEQIKQLLPLLDEKAELLPIVRICLHMTHLLLNPVWGSAWHVLEAVVSIGAIHVYITPQWVYRAGTVLIQNMPAIYGGNLIQLYSNALLVLELSSWKWPSSASLSASLMELMQHMKLKYQPDWSDKLQSGDVRI